MGRGRCHLPIDVFVVVDGLVVDAVAVEVTCVVVEKELPDSRAVPSFETSDVDDLLHGVFR